MVLVSVPALRRLKVSMEVLTGLLKGSAK